MSKTYDVVGIGNAIIDVIATCEDAFLEQHNIQKGIMQLIGQSHAETLSAAMGAHQTSPGGSVGNTLAGIGALGLKTAFVGRVCDDTFGYAYARALQGADTAFPNPPVAQGELPTSCSMIFVTPDGERSMNTYLGISAELGPEDVHRETIRQAKFLFLEGYLYDKRQGKAAFELAADLCTTMGGRAGIALSDPFCVDRHRLDFKLLLEKKLDFVIGNESEILSLWETEDLEVALAKTAEICPLIMCTRSSDPVVLIDGKERVEIPVQKVVPVDATGAGDQFAAGALFGLATGRDLETAGRMGCVAAAEVISHLGGRPQTDLRAAMEREGLL